MSEAKEEKAEKVPDGMVSTAEGASTNRVVGDDSKPEKQTADQFFTGERTEEDEKVPANHATKGMTVLGWTEASRLENTAEEQERERKAAERRAKKED